MPKPTPDVRLYTSERLRRLASIVPEGSLLDPPAWDATEPYFEYDGARYAFCSLAFIKLRSLAYKEHIAGLEFWRLTLGLTQKAEIIASQKNREIGDLQHQLSRYQEVANVGGRGLRLAGQVHRLLHCIPLLVPLLHKLNRALRRAKRFMAAAR